MFSISSWFRFCESNLSNIWKIWICKMTKLLLRLFIAKHVLAWKICTHLWNIHLDKERKSQEFLILLVCVSLCLANCLCFWTKVGYKFRLRIYIPTGDSPIYRECYSPTVCIVTLLTKLWQSVFLCIDSLTIVRTTNTVFLSTFWIYLPLVRHSV